MLGLAYDEPSYQVVAELDGVEYRHYESYLVAETLVAAESRDDAATKGFRRLFAYISGANTERAEMNMTAPVQQQQVGRKIAMTTPVQQTPSDAGWTIAFVVPREFTEQSVPLPTSPEVYIRSVPNELRAVLRYSGRWSDDNINVHKQRLTDILAAAGVQARGEVMTAFYNPPFTLPFMRRNEVMVTVSGPPSTYQTANSLADQRSSFALPSSQ